MENTIPDIIIGRLPIYLQALEHMQARGIQSTSSQELGDMIGISAAQIRKDLSQFGEFGKQGKGYAIGFLVDQIRSILKVDRVWDLAIIGAGNLGRAISHYQEFIHHGFNVKLIFDNDPERIGKSINNGFIVQDMTDLVPLIKEAGIKIAMLTVPAAAAQKVTDELVSAGIKSILNYAPITLSVPPDVHVENVDPVIYLQKMTYFLE
jgi:redox-sensing transcriptional repressor